jgi:hypothetical protein
MFKDWGLFERSGSLIVIAGVALAWRDLTGKIDWAKEYAIDEFDKTILALQSEGGLIKRAMNMPRIEELNGQSAEIQKQLAAAKIRARSYEALALIIGTLIWGYGSYLILLISKIT